MRLLSREWIMICLLTTWTPTHLQTPSRFVSLPGISQGVGFCLYSLRAIFQRPEQAIKRQEWKQDRVMPSTASVLGSGGFSAGKHSVATKLQRCLSVKWLFQATALYHHKAIGICSPKSYYGKYNPIPQYKSPSPDIVTPPSGGLLICRRQ